MCHIDLAKLHLKTGDYQNALKSFVKTREFNSTPPQMLEMCMSILEVSRLFPILTLEKPSSELS
jgi:COP9 signalosome complex subunit 1